MGLFGVTLADAAQLKEPLESQVKHVGIHLNFILERLSRLISHGDYLESPFITLPITKTQTQSGPRQVGPYLLGGFLSGFMCI
jgi:hypothetical protein